MVEHMIALYYDCGGNTQGMFLLQTWPKNKLTFFFYKNTSIYFKYVPKNEKRDLQTPKT